MLHSNTGRSDLRSSSLLMMASRWYLMRQTMFTGEHLLEALVIGFRGLFLGYSELVHLSDYGYNVTARADFEPIRVRFTKLPRKRTRRY